MKKGLLVFLGAVIFLFGGICASAQEPTIKINGEILKTDVAPINIEGRIFIPLRNVGEALECEVSWNDTHKAVSMSDGSDIYIMWINRDTLFKMKSGFITGGYVSDVTPQLINEKTMIPIRCISELMGAKVDWIDEEKTVIIDYTPIELSAEEDPDGTLAAQSAELGNFLIDIIPQEAYDAYKDYVSKRENVLKAEIELNSGDIIKLDLFPDLAPVSVSNFKLLAKSNGYDNTTFHRIIKDFVVQGGAYDATAKSFRQSNTIFGEFVTNNYLNLIPHKRGAISMARAEDPNSASNQFFIVHQDSYFLNGEYAAFGEVTEGMEFVDMLAEVKTDENGKPLEDQIIKTVRIIEEV